MAAKSFFHFGYKQTDGQKVDVIEQVNIPGSDHFQKKSTSDPDL